MNREPQDRVAWWACAFALASAGAMACVVLLPGALDRAPRRFADVEAGRLYRGGYPNESELRWLANSVGVRSVVSLMHDGGSGGRSAEEERAAAGLGLRFSEFPMPGDGRADFEMLDAAADRIAEEMKNGAVYLHCSAGKQRSNAATAAYRMKHCGWTDEQAIAELHERFGLDDESEAELIFHLRAYYAQHIRADKGQQSP